MKKGRELAILAEEIKRQRDAKRDFSAPTQRIEFRVKDVNPASRKLTLNLRKTEGTEEFDMTGHFHGQVSSKLEIPKKYYDKMRSTAKDLLVENVNYWFEKKPMKRMVRTLDGKARAFLSNRYRTLDNDELAEAILPILGSRGVDVVSAELTDLRFYVKAVSDIEADVKPGDRVRAGVVISNSEVGHGALSVQPLVYRMNSMNAITMDNRLRKYHTGSVQNTGSSVWEYLRDETRKQSDKALWMQVSDVTKSILDQEMFNQMVEKFKAALGVDLSGDPAKIVEVTAKRCNLSDAERGGVLEHLIKGGDLSAYGLANAISSYSSKVDNYDRATELERVSGEIIEEPPRSLAAFKAA
jgi:uncharacterized protein (UPF0297 family)